MKKPTITEKEAQAGNRIIIFSTVVAIIMSFCLASCGARKVSKSEVTKTETTEQKSVSSEKEHTETNVKKEVVIIEDSKDSTITETIEITPIDATKPSYFNNENITNAHFKKTRTIKKINKTKASSDISEFELNKTDEKSLKESSSTVLKENAVEKQIDRKSFSYWNLLWLLIPIIVYFAYRKLKTKLTI